MNLNQMAFRCPDAEVVEPVRLEGYCLAFRMSGGGNGVATILPKEGSSLEGVLWRISKRDEQRLDRYEGFPYLYGKEAVTVITLDGVRQEIMAYTMNSPFKDVPALPPHPIWKESFADADRTGSIRLLCWKLSVVLNRNCLRKQFLRKSLAIEKAVTSDNYFCCTGGID